jgi:hypothetical protein
MNALSAIARTWPMLSAIGGGLVLLAIAAGAGGVTGGALAAAGVMGLGWGALSLRAGRSVVPAAALGVSAALLAGSGALIGTGFAEATDVAVGPLLAASAFIAVVGGHSAFLVRRRGRAARPAPDAPGGTVDGRASLGGLVVGALLVAGLATPALAATEAGRLAVPHGDHDSRVTDTDDSHGHGHGHGNGHGHGDDGHHH